MLKITFASILFSILLQGTLFAQVTEDFEDGDSKNFWSEDTISLSSGDWYLSEALIGTDERDAKNGERSVRIRRDGDTDGTLQMEFDYPEGAEQVRFYLANSGFANDTGGELEVEYSTDSGSSWSNLGDPIIAPDALEEQTVDVGEEGDIRFRFVHAAGGRMNIDDIHIEPFFIPDENPTISIQKGNNRVSDGSKLTFPATNINTERPLELEVGNTGEPDLEITDIYFSDGTDFKIETDITGSFETSDRETITLNFLPTNSGGRVDELIIESNDPNTPEFRLQLEGLGVDEGEINSIEQVREFEFGTRVTVAGRVTVANEFDGPVFLQDETAGIAAYYEPLHNDVQRGDSLHITGPITEFNPTGSGEGTFLLQIAEVDGDDNISYEIIDAERREIEPLPVTIQGINSGNYESQIIRVLDVTIDHSGSFQGNTNYGIEDHTDEGVLRIDNTTDVVGAEAPEGSTEIVGVVDRFNDVYQLKPRDTDDIDAEPFVYPYEDIPKSETFDVATWNIEWFGDATRGPENVDLQLSNVITVVETIDADLYTFQEIVNREQFKNLVNSLDDYSGFMSSYSQTQQTAYLFKTGVVDSLDSGELHPENASSDWEFYWAGRPPLFFEFDATVDGRTKRVRSYNVHAKAFGDEPSYNRRQNASREFKAYLDEYRSDENVLFIGDYNDQLILSTYNEEESPYSNFVESENYLPITLLLEERGQSSYLGGNFSSMIDHIITTNALSESYLEETVRIENPNYISSFVSTTSDHAPVWTRFQFTEGDSEGEPPPAVSDSFELKPNYPNPFRSETNIEFSIPEAHEVTIEIFDVMGQQVSIVIDNQTFTAGVHSVPFNAPHLASGFYLYRVMLGNGNAKTDTMTLIN